MMKLQCRWQNETYWAIWCDQNLAYFSSSVFLDYMITYPLHFLVCSQVKSTNWKNSSLSEGFRLKLLLGDKIELIHHYKRWLNLAYLTSFMTLHTPRFTSYIQENSRWLKYDLSNSFFTKLRIIGLTFFEVTNFGLPNH